MLQTLTILAQWLAGFSVFACLALMLTFATEVYRDQTAVKSFGCVVLVSLGILQASHALMLPQAGHFPLAQQHPLYLTALLLVGPGFYGLVRTFLTGDALAWRQLFHFAPALLMPWLWPHTAFPLAFSLGTVYLLALIFQLAKFHHQRENYPLEIGFLGIIFLTGLGVVILGLLVPIEKNPAFTLFYACGIGLILLLTLIIKLIRPQLANIIQENIQSTSYSQSTLKNQDCEALLQQLDHLMTREKLYADPQIQMGKISRRLGISAHQLSELINTRLGKGFSRYLREHRIQAAKAMLTEEVNASVLSVGLNVGFTSSSNFYDAFRELEGMTPGQFRKLHRSDSAS